MREPLKGIHADPNVQAVWRSHLPCVEALRDQGGQDCLRAAHSTRLEEDLCDLVPVIGRQVIEDHLELR